jgi:hypothetical protein
MAGTQGGVLESPINLPPHGLPFLPLNHTKYTPLLCVILSVCGPDQVILQVYLVEPTCLSLQGTQLASASLSAIQTLVLGEKTRLLNAHFQCILDGIAALRPVWRTLGKCLVCSATKVDRTNQFAEWQSSGKYLAALTLTCTLHLHHLAVNPLHLATGFCWSWVGHNLLLAFLQAINHFVYPHLSFKI